MNIYDKTKLAVKSFVFDIVTYCKGTGVLA